MTLNNKISSHYKAHSADSYENGYFSESGTYMQHLVDLVSRHLKLGTINASPPPSSSSCCRLMDVGGGTGNFAKALMDRHNNNNKLDVTVVDPYLDPTSSIISKRSNNTKGLRFVKDSAEALMMIMKADINNNDNDNKNNDNDNNNKDTDHNHHWRKVGWYHKVLLKEAAHHFSAKDRVQIFKGIYHSLGVSSSTTAIIVDENQDDSNTTRIGGGGTITTTTITNKMTAGSTASVSAQLLIVTRPQIEIDYPLWEEARQVWKENQPSASDFMKELEQAGFVNIQQTLEPYPCQIPLDRWQSMVKAKFWSTFSNFSDEELEAACERIAKEYADRVDSDGILHFEDRLVFISAEKMRAS